MQDRFKFRVWNIYGCDWSTVKQRIYENPELLEGNNDKITR